MKRAVLTLVVLAAIVVGGQTISVADDTAQPAPAGGAAAPAQDGQKAIQNSGGCMPDGGCCGNGGCAQAVPATDKSAGSAATGGCPCGKMKQAPRKPAEG